MGDHLPCGNAGGQAADPPFHLLPVDSEHFIRWDPPRKQDTSSGGGEEEVRPLVVLLGWLGAPQKHLRRYADLYRDRGYATLRHVVPLRQFVGLHFGRRVERKVAKLSAMIAAWCDADNRRTLLFHTFSHTGWLTYGAVLLNLQSRPDIIEKIRGCITDSGPVLEIRPEVWAAGFSTAMLKKRSSLTRPPSAESPPDGPTLNGSLSKVNDVSKLTRPSWPETFVLSTLRKVFKTLLRVPEVNKKLGQLLAVLSEKQPSCPQFYLYSSADRVIPAEYVESFITTQITLGLILLIISCLRHMWITTGPSLTSTRPSLTSSSTFVPRPTIRFDDFGKKKNIEFMLLQKPAYGLLLGAFFSALYNLCLFLSVV